MTALTLDPNWRDRAGCRQVDPELFHNPTRAAEARHVCLSHCPVRAECLRWARNADLTHPQVVGGLVWAYQRYNRTELRPRRYQAMPARSCELCVAPVRAGVR